MGCYELGISYAVVTKVKEFTETRQYGEALDILEGQDIFQSLNPQFLRCCGKVYLENDRFYEAREALVRAHIMAPEGNRIIYDLVHLYLKMGYFQRAGQYYELYAYNAVADDIGTLYLQYMIKKAQRVDAGELLGILQKACEEQYSDEWGFELALLYASLGRKNEMKDECIHIMAAFRQSPYSALAEALKKDEYDISNSYFRFPIMEAEEDLETYASILEIEEAQLAKDMLRVHPPEPVILQMEDDDGTEEPVPKEKGTGFKLPFGKRHSKAAEPQGVMEHEVPAEEAEQSEIDRKISESFEKEETDSSAKGIENTGSEETASPVQQEKPAGEIQRVSDSPTEDVSAYIESVMKSVADIEASVAEELQKPVSFQSDTITRPDGIERKEEKGKSEDLEEKPYQPKLLHVEEDLSPKERLEKLMKLIEEERLEEEQKHGLPPVQTVPEELDLDEYLMNLVGASTITQAMVKTYQDEQEQQLSGDGVGNI